MYRHVPAYLGIVRGLYEQGFKVRALDFPRSGLFAPLTRGLCFRKQLISFKPVMTMKDMGTPQPRYVELVFRRTETLCKFDK